MYNFDFRWGLRSLPGAAEETHDTSINKIDASNKSTSVNHYTTTLGLMTTMMMIFFQLTKNLWQDFAKKEKPGYLSKYSDSLRTGRPGFDPRQRHKRFLPISVSRPALGPTQPPVQCVPGVLSPGVKRGRGVMLTTHPHLVPRLSMSRSYTSSPPMFLHGV
jgi:hypothetical protein